MSYMLFPSSICAGLFLIVGHSLKLLWSQAPDYELLTKYPPFNDWRRLRHTREIGLWKEVLIHC
ncbi:unnamed protein product [Nezara viridula]|uniref:Uncharacterized protein n=1 Tax=Nezara viridula TaxID=85310 RepID=A0A9P0HML3_NEZVI|nr:unnamed protein product [Nezara viridula]